MLRLKKPASSEQARETYFHHSHNIAAIIAACAQGREGDSQCDPVTIDPIVTFNLRLQKACEGYLLISGAAYEQVVDPREIDHSEEGDDDQEIDLGLGAGGPNPRPDDGIVQGPTEDKL